MTPTDALVRIDPTLDPRWDALMRGPRGSLFGSPPWLRAIANTYRLPIAAHILVDGEGEPRAGLAHVELDDLRGHRRISVPFVDRLEPVVDSVEDWQLLSAPLFADPGQVPVEVSLRVLDAPIPAADPRLHVHHELGWHSTDLRRTADDIFRSLHSGARVNIRRAERSGVSIEVGDSLDHVLAFHRLHRMTRRYKYGLLAQPAAFFEEIWRQFASSGAIDVVLARLDGHVIAGALYLQWNDVYYYKFGASLGSSLNVRPNELVHWTGLTTALTRRCAVLDWGVSDLDQPGLLRYKRKFATDERRVAVLRRIGAVADARTIEAGQLLGRLTSLFTATDVPEDVAAQAGDLLYRYFA